MNRNTLANHMNGLLTEYHFLLSYQKRQVLRTMSDTERRQLLDSVVRSGPSETSWNAILELFASWPDSTAKEQALSWCNQQLQLWNDTQRSVNSAWRFLYKNGNEISPVARIIRSIHILQRKENGNTELKIISRSSYIKNVKRLVIRSSGLYADGLHSLVNTPYLGSLTHLAIESLTLNEKELNILFSASRFASLNAIRLKNAGLNTKKIAALMQSSLIKKIQKLDLSFNHLDDESVSLITSFDGTKSMKYLNLEGNFIRDKGAGLIAQASNLQNLYELILANNHLTQLGMEAVIRSEFLKNTKVVLD